MILRRFDFLLGNPMVIVATYEAYSEEEAWNCAREEYGTNTFFGSAQMQEQLDWEGAQRA